MILLCNNCINFASWGNFYSKWGNVCHLGLFISLSFFALFGNWVSNEWHWKMKLVPWVTYFVEQLFLSKKKHGSLSFYSNWKYELNHCVFHVFVVKIVHYFDQKGNVNGESHHWDWWLSATLYFTDLTWEYLATIVAFPLKHLEVISTCMYRVSLENLVMLITCKCWIEILKEAFSLLQFCVDNANKILWHVILIMK